MLQPITRLEDIKILENARSITTTKDLIGDGIITYDKESIQFRPGIVLNICILAFCSVMPVMVLCSAIFNKNHTANHIAGLIVGGLLGLSLLIVAVRQISEKKDSLLVVDRAGIRHDNEVFDWVDIEETAIMLHPAQAKFFAW